MNANHHTVTACDVDQRNHATGNAVVEVVWDTIYGKRGLNMNSMKRYRVTKYDGQGGTVGTRYYARTISEAHKAAKQSFERLLAIDRIEIERRLDSPLELVWRHEDTLTR
jgi:hypothetical protein